MTARLLLDDPLQTYTAAEIAFLKLLANRLPKHVRLRSCHDDGGALIYLFEIGLAQRVTFKAGAEASLATIVAQALHNLSTSAREAVDALNLQDGNSVFVPRTHCGSCGNKLIPRPGKRRHETLCSVCEDGKVDEVSQNLIDRAKRGEHPRRW